MEVQVSHLESNAGAHASYSANRALLAVAVVLLAIPVVALLWVHSYARVNPTLAGFPFFIWYQFLWVFLCALCTWAAHRVVLIARPRRRLGKRGVRGKESA
jgi:membrane protein implicated in regulation of membrane protease activity